MSKLSVIIVDDEKNSSETLQLLLQEFEPDVDVWQICNSAKEALEVLSVEAPDLVFLDIEMPKMNGFELLKRLGDQYPAQVVFTTAYNQYGITAIEHNAADYLLKPISIPRLHQAVEKARKRKNELLILQQAQQRPKSQPGQPFKIGLPSGDGVLFVQTDDILRCEAQNNYTLVFFTDGKKLTLTKTMGEVESILPENEFCRLHRSHLINIRYIQKYIRTDGGYILMQDGTQVEISRRKKDDFLRMLGIHG